MARAQLGPPRCRWQGGGDLPRPHQGTAGRPGAGPAGPV